MFYLSNRFWNTKLARAFNNPDGGIEWNTMTNWNVYGLQWISCRSHGLKRRGKARTMFPNQKLYFYVWWQSVCNSKTTDLVSLAFELGQIKLPKKIYKSFTTPQMHPEVPLKVTTESLFLLSERSRLTPEWVRPSTWCSWNSH